MTADKLDATQLRRMAGLCRRAAREASDQEIYAKFIALAIDLETKAGEMPRVEWYNA
jgi:hypothetical protein